MTTRSAAAKSGSTFSRFYFVIWLSLGAAGIFYVTIASLAPDALRSADASQATLSIEATNRQVALLSSGLSSAKTTIELTQSKQQALASGLDGLRGEISGIKAKVTELSSLENNSAAHVAELDPKPAASANTKSQAIAARPAVAAAPPISGDIVSADTEGASPSDLSSEADTAADIPVKAAQPVKPAKIASAASDSKKETSPAKPFAVNLGVSTSPDALKQIWQLFKDQHGELLSGLTPRAVTAGGNVRLLAGPLPSLAAANTLCAKLKKDGMSCTTSPLAGTPL
jgi:SPOR domain